MTLFKGEHICLRALEPDDLEFLYDLENDPGIWEVSGTLTPYSKKVLREYLSKAHQDIYEARQLRLAICGVDGRTLGLIDLYDFNPRHQRAGIGIVISEAADRDRGYGGEALRLICDYAFGILRLHQVYAHVSADNQRSIHLFQKVGFQCSGIQKDWLKTATGYQDVHLYQKIKRDVS